MIDTTGLNQLIGYHERLAERADSKAQALKEEDAVSYERYFDIHLWHSDAAALLCSLRGIIGAQNEYVARELMGKPEQR